MVPWPIRRVTDLPPSAKMRKMQQNTHGLVQLIRDATPTVPNQTPMPQLSKFCVGAETTTAELGTALGSPKVLP